jgi:hypothetical protein
MTIPNFKSQEDWEAFASMFDARWHCKKALLDRVKDDLYSKYEWFELTAGALETINDIVQSLLYDTEFEFEQKYPEYKRDMDDIFVPRGSFKQEVTEALLEANQKFWNKSNESFDLPTKD